MGEAAVEAAIDRITFDVAKGETGTATRFSRILVAVDGSPGSAEGLAWGIGLAGALGARLAAVCVGPPASLLDKYKRHVPGWNDVRLVFEEHVTDPMSTLAHARQAAKAAGLDMETFEAHGTPAAQIVEAAGKWEADLLVLGSHGHSALERLVDVGMVADAVKHRAACSVLLARGGFPPRTVLAGTDGSAPSRSAALTGVAIADALKARAVVVHSFDAFHAFMRKGAGKVGERLDVASRGSTAGTRTFRVVAGDAAQSLMDQAGTEGAQLIVVGSRGMGAVRSAVLGSVSDRVSRAAKASVLIVK